MPNSLFRQQLFCSINCNLFNSEMKIRMVYMIIRNIKLVHNYVFFYLALRKRLFNVKKSLTNAGPIGISVEFVIFNSTKIPRQSDEGFL